MRLLTISKFRQFLEVPLNRTIQTAGNNLYSFTAVTFERQNLTSSLSLTGTVTLTFPGTIPYGSRMNFAVTAGNTPCTTQPQKRLGYVYSDHLDTPRLISNVQGQALWKWDSDAFGTTLANENPQNLGTFNYNLRFPGQYYDRETKTHYNYFRDYDPATGRYIQSDPIGLQGGLNLYGYANANPIKYSDPTGENPILVNGIRLAIGAALTAAREAVKRCSGNPVCKCRAIYAGYKAMQAVGCNGSSCAVLSAQLSASDLVVSLREMYITYGCDRVIPTQRDHPGALAQAVRAAANCRARKIQSCVGCQ